MIIRMIKYHNRTLNAHRITLSSYNEYDGSSSSVEL